MAALRTRKTRNTKICRKSENQPYRGHAAPTDGTTTSALRCDPLPWLRATLGGGGGGGVTSFRFSLISAEGEQRRKNQAPSRGLGNPTIHSLGAQMCNKWCLGGCVWPRMERMVRIFFWAIRSVEFLFWYVRRMASTTPLMTTILKN